MIMPIPNPQLADLDDEILVKDADGNFKILRGGELFDLENNKPAVKSALTPPVASSPAPVGKSAGKPRVGGLIFDHADEAEIAALAKEVVATTPKIDLNVMAEEISKDSRLVVDALLSGRMKSAVMARLRDVRDDYETEETLTRSAEVGGLGLAKEQANKLLAIIKSKLSILGDLKNKAVEEIKKDIAGQKEEQIRTRQKESADKEKFLDERWQKFGGEIKKEIYQFKKAEVREEAISPAGELKKLPEHLQSIPHPEKTIPAPLPQKSLPSRLAAVETPLKNKPVAVTPKNLPVKAIGRLPAKVAEKQSSSGDLFVRKFPAVMKRPAELSSQKPRMEDIKVVPMSRPAQEASFASPIISRPLVVDKGAGLVGPVEELREMSLIDFRRLAIDPKEIVRKISDKIDLLQKDSFALRLKGIVAWQESEVNQLHLELAGASLEQGKKIKEIIGERRKAGQLILTEEEFNAIVELNRKLRF